MRILSDIVDGVRTAFAGLRVTLPYIWRKPVTVMYPHQRMELPERSRNRLYVNMDDCIGCDQCARACPVNCIDIETVRAVEGDMPGLTSNGKKKALWVTRFDIDIAKCCYCALCTFPCPTECIYMTEVFEFSEQDRNNLIYDYVTLSAGEIEEKIAKAHVAEEALAARKASAKAASEAAVASAPPAQPNAPAVASSDDPEKSAKLAELQRKMAEARARREAGGAASSTGSSASPAPDSAAAPTGGAAENDKPSEPGGASAIDDRSEP